MADEEQVHHQPAASAAPTRASDRSPERLVRHVFWKYPLLSVVLLVLVTVLAAAIGSPNWPRDTIAGATKDNPGGAVMASPRNWMAQLLRRAMPLSLGWAILARSSC